MSNPVSEKKRSLPHWLMIVYGFPQLTHSIVVLPMALFIPSFYADELALPMAGVGLAIAVSRLLDVVSDPIIGVLSDRLQGRWGRRKPWLACGTPLLLLSAWMVFVPGKDVSIFYLLGWTTLLYFAFTLVDLPYKAWGAELSSDYSERSRVTAWREAFGTLGQILFLCALMIMSLFDINEAGKQLLAIAAIIVICQPFLVTAVLWKIPEKPPEKSQRPISLAGKWSAVTSLFHNRALMRSVAAVILFGTAVLMQSTLHRFVLNHVVEEPKLFAPMILLENLGSLLCLPIWLWISDRIGKHRAVCFAALWMAFWSCFFPLVGKGDIELYFALILLRGSSMATIFFLANSVGADVVDYDTVVYGQQRTGLYFSIWGMASKFSVGLGVLMGTTLPAMFGFNPADVIHPETSISALMMIYGWLSGLFMLLGIPFLWNFPIDSKKQLELREKITTSSIIN